MKRLLFKFFSETLFFVCILIAFNFDNYTIYEQRDYYTHIENAEIKIVNDGLLNLIPKIETEFVYDGKTYKASRLAINSFGYYANSYEIYANTSSPRSILIQTNFWANYINHFLLLMISLCALLTFNYVVKLIRSIYEKVKLGRRTERVKPVR